MVSTHNDLRLLNPYAYPIRLRAAVFDGGIKIAFFGEKEGDRYEITSKIIEELPPPAPIVKIGEKEEILRREKMGARSETYLERYRNGRLLSRVRLREDVYRPVQGIIVKKVDFSMN